MKIKITNGVLQGREFEFTTDIVTIGRDAGNQFVLDTDGVSRCHAEMEQLNDGTWCINDLNSTNGVRVNGVRIDSTAPIADGAEIIIGENTFVVSGLSPEPARVIFSPIISAPVPEVKSTPEKRPAFDAGKISFKPAGTPVPEPAPEPKKEAEEKLRTNSESSYNKGAESMNFDFSKLSGSLFGRKENKQAAPGDEYANPGAQKSKKRSNMIFYAIVACVVIMILSLAYNVISPKKSVSAGPAAELPLAVRYEKEIIAKDNVFRFEFHLKSTIRKEERKDKEGKVLPPRRVREYTVAFTIDDINSHRHFSRETPVSDESVAQLRAAIGTSGIFAAPASPQSKDESFNRTLTVVEGSRMVQVHIPGEYGSNEFNAVEDAVIQLTEAFGLKTISMTPEQLIVMAENYFDKAEGLFANPGRAGNLRDAIKRYQAVVESLEQFSPKPPMWDKARQKLAEATKERERKMEALSAEYTRMAHVSDYAGMKKIFLEMMELSDPESKEYSVAKRRLVIIEQHLRKKNKR